ncbi:copper transporter family protein [archaeon]|nr:MAG: copper transporter family protein [archaeon]
MALMLMLVAMTYNPSLFLALVVGYFVGSFFFYRHRDLLAQDDAGGCH